VSMAETKCAKWRRDIVPVFEAPRRQAGFFDVDDRLKRLSDLGDQLEAFEAAVEFEAFRPELNAALTYSDGTARTKRSRSRLPRPPPRNRRGYELRHGLQEAAKARGEPMTREDADYAIDKSLAPGLLDSSGGLNFTAKGFTREEVAGQIVAGQIIERSTAWGQPVGREDAEHMASRGIRHIWYRRILKTVVILIFCMAGVAIVLLTQGS
jgi:hypothetical protein